MNNIRVSFSKRLYLLLGSRFLLFPLLLVYSLVDVGQQAQLIPTFDSFLMERMQKFLGIQLKGWEPKDEVNVYVSGNKMKAEASWRMGNSELHIIVVNDRMSDADFLVNGNDPSFQSTLIRGLHVDTTWEKSKNIGIINVKVKEGLNVAIKGIGVEELSTLLDVADMLDYDLFLIKIGIVDQEKILLNSIKGKEIMIEINRYKSQTKNLVKVQDFVNKKFAVLRDDLIKIIANIGKNEGFMVIVQTDNQTIYENENNVLSKIEIAKMNKIDLTQRIIELYDAEQREKYDK